MPGNSKDVDPPGRDCATSPATPAATKDKTALTVIRLGGIFSRRQQYNFLLTLLLPL